MHAAGAYSIEITKILIDHPGVELNLKNKVRCVLSTYCTDHDMSVGFPQTTHF